MKSPNCRYLSCIKFQFLDMKTEVCHWLKKLDESKIHFNLQCLNSSLNSTYTEGNTIPMKASISDKFLSTSH